MRLRRRLQYEERKCSNQRKVTYDSFIHFLVQLSCWSKSLLSRLIAHYMFGPASLWCRNCQVVKLCCRKDLACLHGEGCITAVPFAHIPVVPREVQTMDGSKYEVWTASIWLPFIIFLSMHELVFFVVLNFRSKTSNCSHLIFFSIIIMYLILISIYVVFAEESSYPKPLLG